MVKNVSSILQKNKWNPWYFWEICDGVYGMVWRGIVLYGGAMQRFKQLHTVSLKVYLLNNPSLFNQSVTSSPKEAAHGKSCLAGALDMPDAFTMSPHDQKHTHTHPDRPSTFTRMAPTSRCSGTVLTTRRSWSEIHDRAFCPPTAPVPTHTHPDCVD